MVFHQALLWSTRLPHSTFSVSDGNTSDEGLQGELMEMVLLADVPDDLGVSGYVTASGTILHGYLLQSWR